MDVNATLNIIASLLTLVAAALPLYIYLQERKKSKDENKPNQTGPVTRSEPEV